MKLIIAGSRDVGSEMESLIMSHGRRTQFSLDDCKFLEDAFTECGLNGKVDEIVSGTAYGADKLGEQLAEKLGLKLTKFPADWDAHGKAAGPIRNEQMGDYADAALILWDTQSRGALHMFKYMNKIRKPVFLFHIVDGEITNRIMNT